jgi:hypothetical protein
MHIIATDRLICHALVASPADSAKGHPIMRIAMTVVAGLIVSACTSSADLGIAGPGCTPTQPTSPVPFIQGSLTATGNVYDWALDGPGYFQVLDRQAGRIYYTRQGAFKLTAEGNVVTRDGEFPIEPPVTIHKDGNAFQTPQVTPDGFVIVPRLPGNKNSDFVAAKPYPSVPPGMVSGSMLHVAMFADPRALTPGPNGLLQAAAGTCPLITSPGRLAMYAGPSAPPAPWDATGSVVTGKLEAAPSATPSPAPSR